MDIPSFSTLNQCLDSLLQQGVKEGVFSGGAAAVFSGHGKTEIQIAAASGQTRMDENGIMMDKDIFFDLASLTKPLVTGLSVYRLIEQGIIDWNERYIDISKRKIPVDKRKITIAHLLSHSSGLSAYRPYFELFRSYPEKKTKEELVTRIISDPLAYETGTESRYSDLGYILLGDLIEQVTGQPLDHFFREQITEPLGLEKELFYLPLLDRSKYPPSRFAATELCRWRGRVIQGEVHDEHCCLMGGVAGHAGLFGTVRGVAGLCTSILDAWQGWKNELAISREVLDKALRRGYADSDSTWCLGFDTPSTGYTSGGRYLSKKSIGHLGYTGTSVWIDPEKNAVLVLLTNRVHPTRENIKIRDFRPWFHDRILEHIFSLNP